MNLRIGISFGIALLAAPLQSAMLNSTDLNSKRVGIMISTFDPLTTYHEDIIEHALASGKLDYLVVIPTDFTPHKPRRETMNHRQNMLKLTYKDHGQVLVTDPYQFHFPQSRSLTEELKKKFPKIETTGVVLFEDMKGSDFKRGIASFLTPTQSWLVLTPEDADTSKFPKKIGSAPVEFTAAEHPQSSSKARKFLKGNLPFYEGSLTPNLEELPVNESVRNYIRSHKLYLKKASACAMAIDIVLSFKK